MQFTLKTMHTYFKQNQEEAIVIFSQAQACASTLIRSAQTGTWKYNSLSKPCIHILGRITRKPWQCFPKHRHVLTLFSGQPTQVHGNTTYFQNHAYIYFRQNHEDAIVMFSQAQGCANTLIRSARTGAWKYNSLSKPSIHILGRITRKQCNVFPSTGMC